MLPRSCLRLADSKSNSSTRLPRTTTTRVSSGWVASISILLGIDQSLSAQRRRAPPPGRRSAEKRLTVVEWMGLHGAHVPAAGNSVARRRVDPTTRLRCDGGGSGGAALVLDAEHFLLRPVERHD